MEEERSVWEQKVEAEKENNCELEVHTIAVAGSNYSGVFNIHTYRLR